MWLFRLSSSGFIGLLKATAPANSITGGPGVPLNGTGSFTVQISNNPGNPPITLTLATTTGTNGAATFADGTTSMAAANSQPQTVTVKGATASSTANNITLTATAAGATLATIQFSVVSVSITMNGQKGSQPSAADSNYAFFSSGNPPYQIGAGVYQPPGPGSPSLACAVGVEFRGAVTPSNYAGPITLRRGFATTNPGELYFYSNNSNVAQGLFTSGNFPGYVAGGDDTSPAQLLDTDPTYKGSGTVFDLDAPGIGLSDNLVPHRVRTNFIEYAVLGVAPQGTPALSVGPVVSANFPWWVAVSCTQDNEGNLLLSNDVAGDNQVGQGQTKTTWNMQ